MSTDAKPQNAYQPWTPEEEAACERMLREGHSKSAIAAAIGRSKGAVEAFARRRRERERP